MSKQRGSGTTAGTRRKRRTGTSSKHSRINGSNGKPITDEINAWLHQTDPTLSADGLLSRPLLAMRMGINIARKTGRVDAAAAMLALEVLKDFQAEHAATVEAATQICVATMNGRKGGKIKALQPKRKERSSDGAKAH